MSPETWTSWRTRFILFTGKGGVGKTSLSAATALALADGGQRVLLVSTDAASNLDEMLGSSNFEGVRVHRRVLRFLNLHFRAVRNVLVDVDAIEVDFHNQRLHAVFAKPYADEAARINKAIATAQLISDVLARLMPECKGTLYIYANSRDTLDVATTWNGPQTRLSMYPDDCWSIRRNTAR